MSSLDIYIYNINNTYKNNSSYYTFLAVLFLKHAVYVLVDEFKNTVNVLLYAITRL